MLTLLLACSEPLTDTADSAPGIDATWIEVAQLETARAAAGQLVLEDGRLLLVGGADDQDQSLASTELFAPLTGSWSEGPEMSQGRVTHASAVLGNGDVVITGGLALVDGTPGMSGSVQLFDASSEALHPIEELPAGRAEHTISALDDGRLLLAGGGHFEGPGQAEALGTTLWLDPSSMSWSEGPELTIPRAGHPDARLGDQVLALGGESGDLFEVSPTASCELLEGETWRSLPELPMPLVGHAAMGTDNGVAIVAGGHDGEQTWAGIWAHRP